MVSLQCNGVGSFPTGQRIANWTMASSQLKSENSYQTDNERVWRSLHSVVACERQESYGLWWGGGGEAACRLTGNMLPLRNTRSARHNTGQTDRHGWHTAQLQWNLSRADWTHHRPRDTMNGIPTTLWYDSALCLLQLQLWGGTSTCDRVSPTVWRTTDQCLFAGRWHWVACCQLS